MTNHILRGHQIVLADGYRAGIRRTGQAQVLWRRSPLGASPRSLDASLEAGPCSVLRGSQVLASLLLTTLLILAVAWPATLLTLPLAKEAGDVCGAAKAVAAHPATILVATSELCLHIEAMASTFAPG